MTVFKAPIADNLVGLGLRVAHITHILQNHHSVQKDIGWLEVHSENYYAKGGPILNTIKKVREHFPLSLHSVGNSLGSAQKIDIKHLEKLKKLIAVADPFLVSDHISWGMVDGKHMNDLLPLPYNKSSLKALCDNISCMQDYLQRQVLIENPSSYLTFNNNDFSEVEFINEVTQLTGCSLLLDVNNIFVSTQNNKNFDAFEYLDKIDKKIVKEIHLAGHSSSEVFDGENYKEILIDTHDNFVRDEVWELYKKAIETFGKIPTLIEWDQDVPEFEVLLGEAKKAKDILYNE